MWLQRGTEDLAPLAYWFGHTSASQNANQFRRAVSTLAAAVVKRLEFDPEAQRGGLLVNTCGWVDGLGYELLQQQIVDFKVDVLVVIGDDRLHSQLEKFSMTQPRKPAVIKLSKSGGVITRSVVTRQASQSSRIREYFYGTSNELCPHSSVLDLTAIQVFNIGMPPQAPMSALPIGVRLPRDQLVATLVLPAQYPSLLHSVLAVVLTDNSKADDLLQANAAGFVLVTAVDMERQKITLLSPSPFALPSTRLLTGSVKWQDSI